MKANTFFLVIILMTPFFLNAQDTEDDPLAESHLIQVGGGDELVAISTYPELEINIYKYYKAFERYTNDTLLKSASWSEGIDLGYSSVVDLELADLDGDELHEILAAWIDNNKLEMLLLSVDPARLNVDTANAWNKIVRLSKSSPAPYVQTWPVMTSVCIKSCNLDSDTLVEFVTAYWADDGMIEITAYDVDDTLAITEMGSIRDHEVQLPADIRLCEDEVFLYDIECADFNGDGIDEILLSGRQENNPQGYLVFANIYAYNEGSKSLEAKVKDTIFSQAEADLDIGNFNMASGHFHLPDKEHAVVGIFHNSMLPASVNWTDDEIYEIANILIPLDVNSGLSEITVGEPIYQRQDTIAYKCYYNRHSTLRAADLNEDGMDELLSACSFSGLFPVFKIYQGNSSKEFSVYADLDQFSERFYTSVPYGNFYRDSTGSQSVELIITSMESGSATGVYEVKTHADGSFDQLELKHQSDEYHLYGGKFETALSGNFDTDIRLGTPKRYSVTEILQPLVILNAPPIHFDIFENQVYDVCRSYNENQGEFIAEYIKENQQSTEVRTQINRDWSMSKTLSAGFSYWGVSVSAYLKQEYGEKFEKKDGEGRTVSVGFEIDAQVDDQIYATVMDYDLWEYPVYGNSKLQGQVLVVEPQIVKNSWFDSKSWKGYSYIPNHEVGNILSYRRYPILSDNPMLNEKIKGDYGLETSFLLSANSSYDWFLNFSDFTEAEATTTKEYTRDWGVSVSFWGSGYSMDGSYHSEDIQTQRTTIENSINLNVHLDAVDMSIGETRYEVTPYAYWASNGALVVDYAVAPELAGPGGEDTWWDMHYGYLPDPAFILPWRYDPEKGHAISEAKRYQTNDILFHPEDPEVGDTITIHAQVHNFSLLPTPNPIGVRFYVGDPENGGTPIIGVGGVEEVFTNGMIPPRGTMVVEMKWEIPEDLSAFPRIYAEIDADSSLTEIHENNNRSWNILQKTTGTPTSAPPVEDSQTRFIMEQNFPNPFSELTRIRYSLAVTKHVSIEIYNYTGQKVETLVDQTMAAGSYELEFNGHKLNSGIYFCRIRSGGNQQVMKMVLCK